ncbi:hypothetical protein LTR17_019953 [Elasticomyces elasticus]|nr:hypothetical protein LTR17_019953 [Elasticomyces elasticus]
MGDKKVFGVISHGSTSRSLAHLDVLLSPGEFFSLNQLVHGRIGQSVLLSNLKLSCEKDIEAWQATIAGGDKMQVQALEEHDFKFCRCEGGVAVYHAPSDRAFIVKEASFEQLRETLKPYTQVTLVGEDYNDSPWWDWDYGSRIEELKPGGRPVSVNIGKLRKPSSPSAAISGLPGEVYFVIALTGLEK